MVETDFTEHMAFQLECKIWASAHISGQGQSSHRSRGPTLGLRLCIKGRARGALGKASGCPVVDGLEGQVVDI